MNHNRQENDIILTDLRRYITDDSDKRDKFFVSYNSTLCNAEQSYEEIDKLTQEQNEDDICMQEMFCNILTEKINATIKFTAI